MNKLKPKIGWQKYENVLEEQLTSTFFSDLLSGIIAGSDIETEEKYEGQTTYEDELEGADNPNIILGKIPVNEKLFEDLGMITNFDCWVAHTNFDITPKIKQDLDSVRGIEVLKIFSRYRFFIGVGKMFNFKSVRHNIEDLLLKKGEHDGFKQEDYKRNGES